jgi:hypothetical protein
MNANLLKIAALTVAVSAAFPTAAQAFVIDFDGDSVAPGSPATAAAPIGVSFLPAVFDVDYDSFGDPIPGTEAWRVDSQQDPETVKVEVPLLAGWGIAPSGSNALDARLQPTLMRFSSPMIIESFSVTLDNSPLSSGNFTPGANDLLFLDIDGAVLDSIAVDQTMLGFVATWNGSLSGVSSILLSSGAFYDDINVTAVPVPAAIWLFGTTVAGLAAARRRTKQG